MTDDDDLLAAELALGLLDPVEAEAVRARQAADAAFAARVAWWEHQFADLARSVSIADDRLWGRIVAALPANDNPAALKRWRAAAVAMMLVATALGTALVMRPVPAPAPPTMPVMVAALEGDGGDSAMAIYTAVDGKLMLAPKTMQVGAGDAELWIIGADQTPHSLGVVDARAQSARRLDAAHAAMIRAGATFAITREQRGGSPTGKPAGPVIAAGTIVSS